MFTSLEEGLAFMRSQMAATMRGGEAEPPASEREGQEWGQLSRAPAFAALAVGVAGGRGAGGRARVVRHGRGYRGSDAEGAAGAGVVADPKPPGVARVPDHRLAGAGCA